MTETLIVLIVFMIALGAVGALALAMHWGHKREQGLVPYFFYLSLLSSALAVALSSRDLSLPDELVSVATGKHPIAAWTGRFATIFMLLTCAERILHRITTPGPGRPLPKLLMFGFFTFYVATIVSPAFFARHPNFAHEYVHVLIIATALMLFTPKEADLSVKTMRNAIFWFLLASFAFLLVRRSHVLMTGYHGIIPFLTVRYAGLASHANTLGPLTVIFLLCLWHRPFDNRKLTWAAGALGMFSLILSQSKTSWISLLLAGCCFAWFRHRDEIAARLTDHRRPLVSVALVGGAMLAMLGMGMLIMFGDVGNHIAQAMNSNQGASLSSFSGRDQIWRVAQEEWDRNPVFGYGLTIWNPAFLIAIRMPFAVHAHSQFYQTAVSAGWVGVIGLIIYVAVLAYLAVRTARASGGVTLAFFVIVFIRGISEVPLSMTGIAMETLAHLMLIIVLTAYYVPSMAKRRAAVSANTPAIYAKGLA
ncbi:O-antigen ligase family protein [[Empedobacter] haloabium]|uniref:O-antigen ligase family protein n=1 Tax=[Empedobacter] haloabium TaxID=592317 RepID=A0ABZ1US01_9BURK